MSIKSRALGPVFAIIVGMSGVGAYAAATKGHEAEMLTFVSVMVVAVIGWVINLFWDPQP